MLRYQRIDESDEINPGVIADFGYGGSVLRFKGVAVRRSSRRQTRCNSPSRRRTELETEKHDGWRKHRRRGNRVGICPTSTRAWTTRTSTPTWTRRDAEADALDAAYRGRIAGLAAAELVALIARYEAMAESAGKVGAFASLNWTQDTQDAARGALMQRVTERGSRLSQKLVFVELELAAAPDEAAAAWLADPALARYRHWLEVVRITGPAPAQRAGGEDPGREGRHRAQRLGSLLRRDHGAARYELDGEEADPRPGADPALFTGPDAAPARRRRPSPPA